MMLYKPGVRGALAFLWGGFVDSLRRFVAKNDTTCPRCGHSLSYRHTALPDGGCRVRFDLPPTRLE